MSLNIKTHSNKPPKKTVWAHSNNIAHGHSGKQNKNINFSGVLDQPAQEKFTKTVNTKNLLKKSASAQPSFKGFFSSKGFRAIYKSYQNPIRKNIKNFALDVVDSIQKDATDIDVKGFVGKRTKEVYEKYISDFVSLEKQSIDAEEILGTKRPSIIRRLGEGAISPVTGTFKWVQKNIFNVKLKEESDAVKNFEVVEQLIEAVDSRLTEYCKVWDIDPKDVLSGKNPELYDEVREVIKDKVVRARLKEVDPEKSPYSTKTLSISNRFISGFAAAVFLAADAYNTTMRLTKDTDQSRKEGRTRFSQETGRILLTVFLNNTFMSAFKKAADASIKTALAISAVSVLTSEILGRKLVGKPVLPQSYEKIKEMEEKNKNRNDILAKLGRAMNGEKMNCEPVKTSNNVAFTGALSKPLQFLSKKVSYSGDEILRNIKHIEKANPEMAGFVKKMILKKLKREGMNIDHSQKEFEEVVKSLGSKVELLKKDTFIKRLTEAILTPVNWIVGSFTYLAKRAVSLARWSKKIAGADTAANKLQDLEKKIKKENLWQEYQSQMTDLLNSNPVWKASKHKESQKKLVAAESFVRKEIDKYEKEIEGVGNLFHLIENQQKLLNKKDWFPLITSAKMKIVESLEKFIKKDVEIKEKPKTLDEALKNTLGKINAKADGAHKKSYEKSDFTVLNFPVAKGASTFFIISDIYNLTMLHSKGNKDVSGDNTKQRTVQEALRMTYSGYIIKMTTSLFKSLHDKFILGAMGITLLNSGLRESLARKSVGMPILPTSYEKIMQMDKKAAEEKSPAMQFLQSIVGKRKKQDFSHLADNKTKTQAPSKYFDMIKNKQPETKSDFVSSYLKSVRS